MRSRPRRLVLLVSVAGAIACRQLVGIHDEPPTELAVAGDAGDAANGTCGLPFASACAACVATSCCEASTRCAGDRTCAAWAGCFAACGADVACRAQCAVDHPLGTGIEVATLSSCLSSRCEAACSLMCGGLAAALVPPDAAATCESCIAANDCPSGSTCASEVDCVSLVQCIRSCGPGFDCNEACRATHDAGADAYLAFGNDLIGTCGTPCAYGNWWSCVGRVTPPTAKSAATAITMIVSDFVSTQPIADIDVAACHRSDTTCSDPIAKGTTDVNGKVPLIIPQTVGQPGFDGYYDLRSKTGAIVPELLFLSFPLREATFEIDTGVITPAERDALLQSLGVVPDGGGGFVVSTAYDCNSTKAPSVRFSTSAPADAGVQVFYQQGTFFSRTATATDVTGTVVFMNVPAGAVDITATPAILGHASGTLSVLVRDGEVTNVYLLPN